MKFKLLLISILLISAQLFAQEYPEVSIKDIQFIPEDSLLTPPHDYPSVYEGDTVIVTGVVMNSPFEEDGVTERLHSGAPALYIADTSVEGRAWSGIILRLDDVESDAFAALDSGYVIKAPVIVSSYYTTTQTNVLEFSAENVIGIVDERPDAVPLTLDSLVLEAPGDPNYLAEKWEGVYVELKNLTVDQDYNIGNQSFGAFDENGKRIIVYTESDYWRSQTPPESGTKIDYIRGMIANRNNIDGGWFLINPIYPDDIKFGNVIPPRITEIRRDKGHIGFGEEINVSAQVIDPDGSIAEAKLVYSVNGSDSVEVEMTAAAGDSIYTGTIPAQNDSAIISYYVEAIDDEGYYTSNPNSKLDNPYFLMTLDRPLTIKDVQYNPFGTGISGYNGYEVSVEGIVTADTSMLQGDGNQIGPRIHLQNGTGPWSGIVLFGTEAESLSFGNFVTATGIVNENFSVTTLGSIDDGVSVTVNSENAPVPEPYEITTDMIGTSSSGTLPTESFESVLVKYNNLTVVGENADGDPGYEGNNFGEMLVADESNVSTRVELQEGDHDYHNLWDAELEDRPVRILEGSTIDALIGVLYYSFGNYKLVPRMEEDFINVTDVDFEDEVTPETYSLMQNYPNPFNPSTVISYSLPEASIVKLQVFNILGQNVSTLLDGFQKAGNHKINFNGSNLSSGIYFYRLEANNFVKTMKMMLVK